MREAYQFGPFRLLVHQRELLPPTAYPFPWDSERLTYCWCWLAAISHLVTKDELMAEVWPGVIVEENNIRYTSRRCAKCWERTETLSATW